MWRENLAAISRGDIRALLSWRQANAISENAEEMAALRHQVALLQSAWKNWRRTLNELPHRSTHLAGEEKAANR